MDQLKDLINSDDAKIKDVLKLALKLFPDNQLIISELNGYDLKEQLPIYRTIPAIKVYTLEKEGTREKCSLQLRQSAPSLERSNEFSLLYGKITGTFDGFYYSIYKKDINNLIISIKQEILTSLLT